MSEPLIGFLAMLAVVTVLLIVSMICQAVTDVRIARATGGDPRAARKKAQSGGAAPGPGTVDRIEMQGHPSGGPTN